MKCMKGKKMSVDKYVPSPVALFRKGWLERGFELVDITGLCSFRLGESGWCNEFNEPEENIYHIRVLYRGEQVVTFDGMRAYPIDDRKYVVFVSDPDVPCDSDFIIFRKVRIDKDEGKKGKRGGVV